MMESAGRIGFLAFSLRGGQKEDTDRVRRYKIKK